MLTADLITPPVIVSYTHKHWPGYTAACWIKRSPTLTIKLNAGATYTVYGIFDRRTIHTLAASSAWRSKPPFNF